jgi:hypothetical protein
MFWNFCVFKPLFLTAVTCFIIIKQVRAVRKHKEEPVTSNMDCDDWLHSLFPMWSMLGQDTTDNLTPAAVPSLCNRYWGSQQLINPVCKHGTQHINAWWWRQRHSLKYQTLILHWYTLIFWEEIIVYFILYDCTGGMSEEQSITNTKVSEQY